MSSLSGRFIVIEGADGCGKSTQARRLVAALAARGLGVIHVREPGSTRVGESVRSLLLDRGTGALSARTETLLYLAARAQLVEEVVVPALDEGTHVVCERWTLSTEVYQGVAAGLGADVVRAAAPLAENGVRPDLVLVLDVDEGEGLRRLSGEPDRMESKGAAFHERVVRGYRELTRGRDRHALIAAGSAAQVEQRIAAAVVSLGL
jgi:dTMP kinase